MIPLPRTGTGAFHHHRLLVIGLLAAGLLLAGCGAPASTSTDAVPAPSAGDPPAEEASTPGATPLPTGAPAPAIPVALPWPAANAADAAELQSMVDGGAQPWLLDPAEVALSYASTAHGWISARAAPGGGGTTVEVLQDGQRLALSLAQPCRAGAGGIWVVTAETGGP